MTKLLVYSHDTYGLGNIRRMLAICDYLVETIPDLSILLVTGSPVIHSLRLPEKMDYIKLPCLTRVGRGEYTTKYLNENLDDAIALRGELIRTTVQHFRPDIVLVDKKPMGVKRELGPTLDYLASSSPATRLLLVLRDILDRPEAIISNWKRNGHYDAITKYYEKVLILGEKRIFDAVREYQFPSEVASKSVYCGYIRKEPTGRPLHLNSRGDSRLVTVTAGGGQDGFGILQAYLDALPELESRLRINTVMVTGPEMPRMQQDILRERCEGRGDIELVDFRPDLLDLMAASDALVSMSGYNTVCEILSLRKRAVVIPRTLPTEEQLMRAECMAREGLLSMIHPDKLSGESLAEALLEVMNHEHASPSIDLNALQVVSEEVKSRLEVHV